jgi:hypothetical protein
VYIYICSLQYRGTGWAKEYKILEEQWMARAKEIFPYAILGFPCAILGTRVVGWSALDKDTCEATHCHSSLSHLSAFL